MSSAFPYPLMCRPEHIPIARARAGGTPFLSAALFLIGIASTFYILLGTLGGVELRPVQVVPAVLAFAILPFMPVSQRRFSRIYCLAPILWALYMLLRHAMTGSDGMMIALRSVTNVGIYFTTIELLRRCGSSRALESGLIAGCGISIWISALNMPLLDVSPIMGSGRWQGMMPGANRLASLCGFVLMLGIASLLSAKSLRKTLYSLAVAAMSISGLVMSGSRGAILGVGLAVILFCILAVRIKPSFLRSGALIAAGIVLSGVTWLCIEYFEEYAPERIVSFISLDQSARGEIMEDSRAECFRASLEYFLANPMIGSGSDAERFYFINSRGDTHEISAHSVYLYLLSTSGLIGFFLFLLLPANLAYRLFGSIRPSFSGLTSHRLQAAGAIASIVLFLSHGMVISTVQTAHVWIIFAMAAHACGESIHLKRFGINRAAPGKKFH